MFDRVLVPLDGSSLAECVLPHSVAIARTYSSEVLLLRVLDPSGSTTRPRPVDPFEWQIRKAEAETYLQNISARLQKLGISTGIDMLEGRAAEMVINYAQNNNVNFIILSSHGQSGLSPWNVSSIVQQIILRAHTSLMIVRAYQPVVEDINSLRYKRILLPLDGSQRAEGALPIAESLARAQETGLMIAHVVRPPEMPRRTPLSAEDQELLSRITERNREEASKYLLEVKSRVDARVDTRLIVSDRVSSSLHALIEQEEVDLVILSAHGYTGETRWPYGSVVVSFIAYGTTPLLIYQDMPKDRIEPTRAEIAVLDYGER